MPGRTVLGDGAAYIVVSHVEETPESAGACLLADGVVRGLRCQPVPGGVIVAPAA